MTIPVGHLVPKFWAIAKYGIGKPTEVAGLAFGGSCDFERVDGGSLSAEARIWLNL